MGTFLGVPIIMTIVFWGLYWGSPILGNYHMSFLSIPLDYSPELAEKVRSNQGQGRERMTQGAHHTLGLRAGTQSPNPPKPEAEHRRCEKSLKFFLYYTAPHPFLNTFSYLKASRRHVGLDWTKSKSGIRGEIAFFLQQNGDDFWFAMWLNMLNTAVGFPIARVVPS